MKNKMRMLFLVFGLLVIFPMMLHPEVYRMRIDGPIETITEEYVVDSFNKIKDLSKSNAKLVIIEIDTPGGFSSSMRTIIKEMLGSPVPVCVFVSPRGSQSASAGFFIMMAADIACMAPGTNTGAAHPVSITGGDFDKTMKEKVTNDSVAYIKSLAKNRNRNLDLAEKAVSESKSYPAEECLKDNLIEYMAQDIEDLLAQLEGKTITMVNGKSVTLALKSERIKNLDMSARQKFLKTITNPTLALILVLFALAGLYIEFTHPGLIIPGVVGGICLLLAFLAFQVLPINYVGLGLILLSVGFFIAEIKVQGFGILGIGGIISFILGSMMLINAPIPEMRPSMTTIIAFAIMFAFVFLFLTYKVLEAMKRRTPTGQEGLVGEKGMAKSIINKAEGKVFVHGEWWNAVSYGEEEIPEGTAVTIVSVDGFLLKVKQAS